MQNLGMLACFWYMPGEQLSHCIEAFIPVPTSHLGKVKLLPNFAGSGILWHDFDLSSNPFLHEPQWLSCVRFTCSIRSPFSHFPAQGLHLNVSRKNPGLHDAQFVFGEVKEHKSALRFGSVVLVPFPHVQAVPWQLSNFHWPLLFDN